MTNNNDIQLEVWQWMIEIRFLIAEFGVGAKGAHSTESTNTGI